MKKKYRRIFNKHFFGQSTLSTQMKVLKSNLALASASNTSAENAAKQFARFGNICSTTAQAIREIGNTRL